MISGYNNHNDNTLIKSPWYTGDDFMFLYRFVHRRHQPQILVHFGTIIGADLKITWFDAGRFSPWPWPWIFKVKYRIYYLTLNIQGQI